MDKQQRIKEAYGQHWELVKDFVNMEDGSCCGVEYSGWNQINNHPSLNEMGIYQEDNFATTWYDPNQNKHFWRPVSLENIENNNGWIKYDYEKLPKDQDCHVISESGVIVVLSSNVINSISKNSLVKITHYRPIEKPKPPIY